MSVSLGWALAGVLLTGGLLAQLALHLFEPVLPVTWGYAHLSRHPERVWIAAFLTIALPPTYAIVWRRLQGVPLAPCTRARVAMALAAAVAVLAPLSVWAPMPFLSIDPAVFQVWLMRGEINQRSDLWLRLLVLVTRPLMPAVEPVRTAYVVAGVLGGVTMVALVGSARRLARDRAEALTMALLACTAFGVVRMSFGVVDSYPAPLVLMALFFWTALRALDGDAHPVWPLVIGATGTFWYIGLVLILPATLVLLVEELRRPTHRGRAVVGASIAAAAAGLATVPATGRPFAFGDFFAAAAEQSAVTLGTSPTSSLHSLEALLSRQRLYDVVNTCMMVDGVGILCSLTAGTWLAARLLRHRTWDVRAVMLGATAAAQLVYLATFDTLLSPVTQWDPFAPASIATALFGGWTLVRWLRRARHLQGWVAGLALALALVHLLARLDATHLDLERHEVESPATLIVPQAEPGKEPMATHGAGC